MSTGWKGIAQAIGNVVNGMVNSIASKLMELPGKGAMAVNSLRNSLAQGFSSCITLAQSAASRIKGAFENMRIVVPRPLIPYVSVSSASYTVGDKSVSVPRFNVNWYAKGGFFDGASVIGVGEAGREAVLPLENKRNMKPFANAVSDNLRNDRGIGSAQAVTINITNNNTINNDMDIRRVSEQLTAYTEREMRRKGIITGRPKYSR